MPVYPYIWNALVLTFLICSARGHTSESLRSPSLCRHQCSAHDEANYAKHSDHYAFIRIIETARDPTISESDTNTASGRSRRCPRTSRARRRSSRRMYTAPVAHAYRAGPPSGGRPHHIWRQRPGKVTDPARAWRDVTFRAARRLLICAPCNGRIQGGHGGGLLMSSDSGLCAILDEAKTTEKVPFERDAPVFRGSRGRDASGDEGERDR